MSVATVTALAIPIGAAIGAGGVIASGVISSNANQSAANTQAGAVTHGADLQAKATADALTFQKQQAEAAYQSNEATRKANYDQWAAGQQRMGSISELYGGTAPRQLPAYVSQPDPNLAPGGPPPPGGPSVPGSPAGSPSAPTGAPGAPGAPALTGTAANPTDRAYIKQQLTQLYQSMGAMPTGRGTGPTDIEYMADQVANTGGWQGGNAGYWTSRIGQELQKAGGSGGSAPAAAPPTMGSVNDYLHPTFGAVPMTPALQMPQPYQMGSVASYLG
jgi:hypothetical protein